MVRGSSAGWPHEIGRQYVFGGKGSRLAALGALGQSVWLDSISREMLRSGELERYVEAGISGVTSNPTIFAKAMLSGDSYDAQIDELVAHDADVDEIYTAVVTRDIRQACDVMAPTHRRSGGLDGFVSVEVSPELAHEAEATLAEARDWVKRVDQPNLLIKIPATRAGLTAIEAAIAEGISVNVTLIFSLERYLAVIDAYISGLERFRAAGGNPATVNSVASFFVSRLRHRGGQAPRCDRYARCNRASGPERGGQRPCRLPGVPARVLVRPLAPAPPGRRQRAEAALGVHLHQEPGLLRHPVHRHAGGARDGQYPAGGRPSRPTRTTGRTPRTCSASTRWRTGSWCWRTSRRWGSITTTWRPSWSGTV